MTREILVNKWIISILGITIIFIIGCFILNPDKERDIIEKSKDIQRADRQVKGNQVAKTDGHSSANPQNPIVSVPSDHSHGVQVLEMPPLPEDKQNLRRELMALRNRENLSPEEYAERELEILTEDMDVESAVDYLEYHRIYNSAILEQIDSRRALKYVMKFPAPWNFEQRRHIAERVIAEYPRTQDAIDARLHLADYEEDDTKAIEMLQEVLDIEPNSAPAFNGIGAILCYKRPAEAIPYLKQANHLDPRRGDWGLGIAYQGLGDYKTAWIHLKKAAALASEGSLIFANIKAIEAGEPLIKPVQQDKVELPKQRTAPKDRRDPKFPQRDKPNTETFSDQTSWPVEPPSTTDEDDARTEIARKSEAAKKASEEFLKIRELSQKELDDFLQWAEAIMNTESPMDTNNFLMKEMEAHLKGGAPNFEADRIVRAFEIMERYGTKEGIKRLQRTDPDVAKEVQRLFENKRPSRHDTPQSKK